MTSNQERQIAGMQRGQWVVAAGGLFAALAASSCCVLPLILFSLGVSGAWIANLTELAPYQPWFVVATIAFLGTGYWLVHWTSKLACAEGGACARPLPNRTVKAGLIIATALVIAALGVDFLSPLLANL